MTVYQPHARVAILSNSSTRGRSRIRAALELLDLKIMKFDAGSEKMFASSIIGRAGLHGRNCRGLKELKNTFLQSCLVQGRVTNAILIRLQWDR